MSLAESAATDLLLPPRRKMTIEEFLVLPDDGVDRMLLDGELWEMGELTVRGHLHGEVAANIAFSLVSRNRTQPRPRGKVSAGDAGFRLIRGDDSAVGPDVAYASAELVARTTNEMAYYDGSPILAVEVTSRSDTQESIFAKIRKYLQADTVVWQVDPDFQLVQVHRPGQPVEGYNITQELVGDPYLPGFRVAVAEFFDD